jgi:hypothetical protein
MSFVSPPWSVPGGFGCTGRLLSDVGSGLGGALVGASSSGWQPAAIGIAIARPAVIDQTLILLPNGTVMGGLPET